MILTQVEFEHAAERGMRAIARLSASQLKDAHVEVVSADSSPEIKAG